MSPNSVRRQETEQLREQIRGAAIHLFAERGYRGTSIQEVADAVGISKQLLLYHFPSKEALHEAVLGAVAEAWNSLLPLLLDALTSEPARFEAILDDLTVLLQQRRDAARVVLLELVNDESSAAAMDESVRPWMKVAAEFIRRRQADGAFSPAVDPEAWVVQAATLLLSTIALLHLRADKWPEEVDADTWRRRRLRESVRMLQASVKGQG